jgi:tripartite-type tricarboxylate transporter receptor subunit TctC
MRRRAFIAALGGAAVWPLALASLFLGGTVQAQDWPDHLITMVVPYAAGGPVDTVGRIMAAGLSEKLRQQVVIENVGGAGGMTDSSRAAKAAPDGYTLLLGGLAVLGQVPNLYKKPLYNPVRYAPSVAIPSPSVGANVENHCRNTGCPSATA